MSHVACPNQPPSNSQGRCWITGRYPAAQTFLEYMLVSVVSKGHDGHATGIHVNGVPSVQEWTSAFFSFVLYVIVLLRVRGNLIHDTKGKWSLRWIPRSESWQLAFVRDYVDTCTVRLAAITVWYGRSYIYLRAIVYSFATFPGIPYVLCHQIL